MKKFLFAIVLVSIFTSCNRNKLVNRKESKIFGDSLKIEYRYIGDTVYQKWIDLIKENGYDQSNEIRSIWKTKLTSNLNCKNTIHIIKDHLDYTFCLEELILLAKDQQNNKTENKCSKETIENLNNKLQSLKGADTLLNANLYMLFHFIRNSAFSVNDVKTRKIIVKVRIENYKSTYSGGHIYYLINQKKDTVARFNLNDWRN